MSQILDRPQPGGHLLKGPDELPADNLALLLRLPHPFQGRQKHVAIVMEQHVQAQLPLQETHHLLSLVQAQQTMIDKNAGHLVPQHPGQQGGHHAAVNTPG